MKNRSCWGPKMLTSQDAEHALGWMGHWINEPIFAKIFSINSAKQIWILFKKDLLLEIRQQYAFYGVLLYVGATIFVLYMAIENPDTGTWNGLFWIIQLFISINAVAKSFLQESKSRMLYYQSIAGPVNFILAKLLFNSVL